MLSPHVRPLRRRFPRCLSAVALVSGCALGLGACSSASLTSAPTSNASTAVAVPSAPAVKGAAQAISDPGLTQGLVLPLEAYMEPYPEQSVIARAQVDLVEGCMAKFGFTYTPPAPGVPLSNDDANMNRRYGVSDADVAAQYGYHLPNYAAQPVAPSPVSSAEQLVLTGRAGSTASSSPTAVAYHGIPIPHNGCIGSIVAKLGAPLDTSLPDRLDSTSLDQSQAEPVVQKALHAWSACMKSKGYTVDTPFNAPALAASSNGPSPTSQEIEIAEADVACKQQTNLVKIWFTAESAIQNQQVEQNQLALNQLRQQIDAAVKAAATVTG